MQNDIRSSVRLYGIFKHIFGITVARPVLGNSTFLVREGEYFHFFRNHKCRVETKPKMTNNGLCVVLVFFEKLFCARKSNLIDKLVNFFSCHPYSTITDSDGFFLFVHRYANFQITQFSFKFSNGGQRFKFLGSIYCIGNQFTQKNFMIAIHEFLNHGENIFTRNPNSPFCHDYFGFYTFLNSFLFVFSFEREKINNFSPSQPFFLQKKCHLFIL